PIKSSRLKAPACPRPRSILQPNMPPHIVGVASWNLSHVTIGCLFQKLSLRRRLMMEVQTFMDECCVMRVVTTSIPYYSSHSPGILAHLNEPRSLKLPSIHGDKILGFIVDRLDSITKRQRRSGFNRTDHLVEVLRHFSHLRLNRLGKALMRS